MVIYMLYVEDAILDIITLVHLLICEIIYAHLLLPWKSPACVVLLRTNINIVGHPQRKKKKMLRPHPPHQGKTSVALDGCLCRPYLVAAPVYTHITFNQANAVSLSSTYSMFVCVRACVLTYVHTYKHVCV